MRISCVILIGLALVISCGQGKQEKKYLPIVFDDWWNVDFVKNGCEINVRFRPCPSNKTPNETVRQFENELEVAFGSESACHGLMLTHDVRPEMAESAVKSPQTTATGATGLYWSFILDLDGNNETQEGQVWTLVDPTFHATNGSVTNPQRVMRQVCGIVKGVGGKVEN